MTSKNKAQGCRAITSKGQKCKNQALPGKDFCAFHNSAAEPLAEKSEPFIDAPDPRLIKEAGIQFKALLKTMKRRSHGDYEVDEWGFDKEFFETIQPIVRWIYQKYWRVTVTGVENVPALGRALLVANHSGVLPWDGAMIVMAILEEHPDPRLVRALVLSLPFAIPFLGAVINKGGGVQALPANSERLLNQDQLTLVFPEGVKGIGKPFRKRYQLARFGRGGFVRVALNTKSPIIPVSVVGAEEIYPNLYNMKPLASLFGIPYIPVTPFFPLLGPLGVIPLPTKWYIHFGKPIQIPEMAYRRSEEPLLVSKISAQVRDTIQRSIHERLKKRRGVFW